MFGNNMKYANYLDMPDWEKHRESLWEFKTKNMPDDLWWSFPEEKIKEGLPEFYDMLVTKFNLHVKQLIFFGNLTNDINITDPTDSRAIFIHIDSMDSNEQIGKQQPPDQMASTKFLTTNAINIPLRHYEGTYTLWYEEKEPSTVLYTHYGCGGLQRESLNEVFRFQLTSPAVININKPHGVWNPNQQTRWVATMRFHESLEHLF
jgi:hypothetical protein